MSGDDMRPNPQRLIGGGKRLVEAIHFGKRHAPMG
jgi:hypothetical protein